MLVHVSSGTALFEACSQLFSCYPLAVTLDSAHGKRRSMVLLDRAAGSNGFFVLSQASNGLFVIRSWDRSDGVNQGIRPGEHVSGMIYELITGCMPVPHDGALLGWIADNQVRAMLAVHCAQPGTRDATVPGPEIRVMPMAGTSELLHWPPFTVSPLDDGWLWEYVEWGEIVDIGPVIAASAGHAFWVPAADRRSARHGCVVIKDNLVAEEYWLPAGVYMDHWTLREGIEPPPVDQLLTQPGVVDLAHRVR
jgi:hypothetical protein